LCHSLRSILAQTKPSLKKHVTEDVIRNKVNQMKLILSSILLIILSNVVNAETAGKYERGDCITPTNTTYSWYGKYAKVEAFSRVDGVTDSKAYILSFPFSGSSDTIFNKEIEQHTKRVNTEKCAR